MATTEINVDGVIYNDQEGGNVVNFDGMTIVETEAEAVAGLSPTVQIVSITGI